MGVKELFNNIYTEFDSIYSDKGKGFLYSSFINKVFRKSVGLRFEEAMKELQDVKGKSILDIGCGSGICSVELAKRGAKATGIDISEKMIELAEQRAKSEGVSCRFAKKDLFDMKGKFDICIAKGGMLIQDYVSKFNKRIALIILIALLIIGGSQQLNYADIIIKYKANSFQHVKDVGLWVKENTRKEDAVVTGYSPIISYYSERRGVSFPSREREFQEISQKDEIKYFILFSEDFKEDKWEFSYPQKHGLNLKKGFYYEKGKPLVLIYELQ